MELEGLQKLQGPCGEIERLWRECDSLRSQVEDMKYRLDSASTQGVRTMGEVSAELGGLEMRR